MYVYASVGLQWNVVCVCGAGLAGVYNISDHFEFEYGRGVEDISTMTRAMYGPELFERFSPSVIVGNLPRETRFVWRINNCNFQTWLLPASHELWL